MTKRTDLILTFMSLGIIVVSVACFFAILIATGVGVSQESFATGIWPVVAAFPLFGLPVAFVLVIALLVTTFIRRGRAGRRN